MTMTLDVWSDIACPWCYIGKRRLERALVAFTNKTGAPAEYPGDLRYVQRLARKYQRSEAAAQGMIDSMCATAREEGLELDFEPIRAGSTFDAHRLLHLAESHGVQDALKERFFAAYLSEGVLMSDADALVRCTSDVGLDVDAVRDVLATGRYADAVRQDQAMAAEIGVRGVPFFVVAERFGLSGAQPSERILEVLLEASHDVAVKEGVKEHEDGAVCSPDAPC